MLLWFEMVRVCPLEGLLVDHSLKEGPLELTEREIVGLVCPFIVLVL